MTLGWTSKFQICCQTLDDVMQFCHSSLFKNCSCYSQEKLFSSKNRTEASLGKKLKNDMLPEIEKVHKVLCCFLTKKFNIWIYIIFLNCVSWSNDELLFFWLLFEQRKERMLKKQHRQALLLDNFLSVDGLAPGRSLRDRKPVTYTFGKTASSDLVLLACDSL